MTEERFTKVRIVLQIIQATGNYLNFLNYIAVAHWNHIADRALVEASLGGVLVDDYDYFESFIKHVGDARKRKAMCVPPNTTRALH